MGKQWPPNFGKRFSQIIKTCFFRTGKGRIWGNGGRARGGRCATTNRPRRGNRRRLVDRSKVPLALGFGGEALVSARQSLNSARRARLIDGGRQMM